MSLRKFTSITALILITALMICALSACGAPAVDKESAVESAPIASANTIATAITLFRRCRLTIWQNWSQKRSLCIMTLT